MQTIHAIWKDGVFTPETDVDLVEGIRVAMDITATDAVMKIRTMDSAPLPDPLIEYEARPAPFDLPMPSGGKKVTPVRKDFLRPDAHDLAE